MTTRAAVGLGSNLGDRRAHLVSAVEGLRDLGRVVAVSPVYETAPIGGPDQGAYLNAAVLLETSLDPAALLEGCQAIERSRGRERRERWGPRTLDLDLLLFGDEVIDRPGLTVPHPRMTERHFVLRPLLDVWPDACLPEESVPGGICLDGLLDDVAAQEIERLPGEQWWLGPAAVLENPAPDVGPGRAARIAAALYGLEGEAFPLEGERDRNYLLVAGGERYSLKVANAAQDAGLLEMRQLALEHLAGADPGLPVPAAVRTLSGDTVGIADVGGTQHPVRLQTFLPGDRLPDGHSTPASRRSLAALLARLDRALQGFGHPLGVRDDLWDVTRLPDLRPHTIHLAPERRSVVEEELDRFESVTAPALERCARQMIHSDANPANLLTEPGDSDRITGIVDFGDLIEGPLVADVAIAAAYQCLGQDDPAAVAADLLEAFVEHLPLGGPDASVYPGLVAARLVQSHTISAWRASRHPYNREYILIHAEPAWEALVKLRATPGWRG